MCLQKRGNFFSLSTRRFHVFVDQNKANLETKQIYQRYVLSVHFIHKIISCSSFTVDEHRFQNLLHMLISQIPWTPWTEAIILRYSFMLSLLQHGGTCRDKLQYGFVLSCDTTSSSAPVFCEWLPGVPTFDSSRLPGCCLERQWNLLDANELICTRLNVFYWTVGHIDSYWREEVSEISPLCIHANEAHTHTQTVLYLWGLSKLHAKPKSLR